MPDIQLLDGKKISFDKKINGFDLVKKISKSLEKKALIMEVNGDLKETFTRGKNIETLTDVKENCNRSTIDLIFVCGDRALEIF